MMLPPVLRLAMKQDYGLASRAYQMINAVYVSGSACPTCGYTDFTDGARTIPCITCGGTGQVATFTIHRLSARWSMVQLTAVDAYKGIPPGVESGDLMVWVNPRDKDVMDKLYHTKDSYIEVEGSTYAVGGEAPDGVGHPDEYVYICRKRKPAFTYL